MSHTAAQLAEEVRGEVLGDGSTPLTGFAPAAAARAGDLTFAEQESYLATAEQSEASAILVPEGITASAKVLIRVANPRIAMARLLPIFFPPEQFEPGIHPSAEITATAEVDASAHIGAGCVVRDGANIGPRSVLMAGNHIGRGALIGEDCCLHPNVVVYQRSQIGNRVTIHAGSAIGSDGYGYAAPLDPPSSEPEPKSTTSSTSPTTLLSGVTASSPVRSGLVAAPSWETTSSSPRNPGSPTISPSETRSPSPPRPASCATFLMAAKYLAFPPRLTNKPNAKSLPPSNYPS
jgi:hypothetical protein